MITPAEIALMSEAELRAFALGVAAAMARPHGGAEYPATTRIQSALEDAGHPMARRDLRRCAGVRSMAMLAFDCALDELVRDNRVHAIRVPGPGRPATVYSLAEWKHVPDVG
jgi:hypothetical protein